MRVLLIQFLCSVLVLAVLQPPFVMLQKGATGTFLRGKARSPGTESPPDGTADFLSLPTVALFSAAAVVGTVVLHCTFPGSALRF